MKNIIITTLIVISVMNVAYTQELTAREIVDKSIKTTETKGSEMISELKILDAKGRERIRKTAIISKEFTDVKKTIIKFLYPADVKGTGMLIFDYEDKQDDMWIYMPALRKTRRIVSSEKSKSFMGSEFSNADMSMPNLNEFNYKVLGEENLNGISCYMIESTPINEDIADENGFSKRITWIAKDDFLSHKVEYYDLDEELHKITTLKKFELIDPNNGKYIAKSMRVENVQNGRVSIMTIEKYQLGATMGEENFTASYLE